MTTAKNKKAVHFGSELPDPEQAEESESDKSRWSEDATSCPSNNVSQVSARSSSPASLLREWQQNRPSHSKGHIQPSRRRKRPSHRPPSSDNAQSRPSRSTASGSAAASANGTVPASSTVMGSIRSTISNLAWGPGRVEQEADVATPLISEGTEESRK